MIRMSDAFANVGVNGCSDVATSMVMQGCEPEMDIPIYEVLTLHIDSGQSVGVMANSVAEYNALRRLCQSCGAVACSLNICGLQMFTLANAVLIFTPNTGMNAFVDILDIDPNSVEFEMAESILEAAGVPIPEFAEQALGLLNDAIQTLFDKLVANLQDDFAEFGINLQEWEEIWDFYRMLHQTGEMNQMAQFRSVMGAFTL